MKQRAGWSDPLSLSLTRLRMSNVALNEYWLISAPGDKTCQQTWDVLNNVTSKQNSLSQNYKFHIPDLKASIRKWCSQMSLLVSSVNHLSSRGYVLVKSLFALSNIKYVHGWLLPMIGELPVEGARKQEDLLKKSFFPIPFTWPKIYFRKADRPQNGLN